MGRPTEKKQDYELKIRLDSDTVRQIEEYQKKNGFKYRSDVVKLAIKELLNK